MVSLVVSMLPRLHSLVIGPGLGRDETVLAAVGQIILAARERGLPMVIDADGLFLVTEVCHGRKLPPDPHPPHTHHTTQHPHHPRAPILPPSRVARQRCMLSNRLQCTVLPTIIPSLCRCCVPQ